jgi:polo-like kinase 1
LKETIVEERYKLPGGEVGVRRYSKGKFLGKGGFAKCYGFLNKETNYNHAAKVIQKSSITRSRAK